MDAGVRRGGLPLVHRSPRAARRRQPVRLAAAAVLALLASVAARGAPQRTMPARARTFPQRAGASPDSLQMINPSTTSGDATATFVADRDGIAVLELTGSYDTLQTDGSVNAAPRMALANEFYRTHPDEYDFLVVFTDFDIALSHPGVKATHLGIRNDVQGIGLPVFDSSSEFGSAGKLQSFIDMANLGKWSTDPVDPRFEVTLTALGHELLHRWGAHVRFRQPDGTLSSALDTDAGHWSFLLASDASLLYGNAWQDNGDGTFTSTGSERLWSPLDLYLAGFYRPSQVRPFFLINSPGGDPSQLPQTGATISGTSVPVSVDDVIAAEGPRLPAAADSQHEFRVAFLLVTRPGDAATDDEIAAIARIRRELATRFMVLTGGAGVLDVAPQAPPGSPGQPTPIPGEPPRTGPANVLDGLAWLRGHQAADGSWQDTPGTRLRDTAVVLPTLVALDPLFTGTASALSWLGAQPSANLDFAARLAAAEQHVGADGSPARTSVRSQQNGDGGWGAGPGYASDPVDAAVAVLALAAAQPPSPAEVTAIGRGANYLLAAQNTDGGWGPLAGGSSRVLATAAALRAIHAAGLDGGTATAAISWLASKQNADGGFGDSPSSVHETADVLDALMVGGALTQVRASDAAAYLGSRQATDGSWDGSVYSTALAVAALRRYSFPNWAFLGSPQMSPTSPLDGQRVQLTFTVVNNGNAPAPRGALRLYAGDPAQGGTPNGADASIPALAPSARATIVVLWDSLGKAGTIQLVAVLNPDNTVQELSRTDNQVGVSIQVQPPPALADLEVTSADLAVVPAQPSSLPVSVAIAADVRNLGLTDVSQLTVALILGPPATGTVIDHQTIAVPQRSITAAQFFYNLTKAGSTTFSIVVDPDNQVPEASKANNAASVTVRTSPNIDLAIAGSDLSLSGTPYVGGDVTFNATFHNLGTVDSPATSVRYQVSDGTTAETIATNPLQIPAGQSLQQAIPWRVDLTGSLVLMVTLDPDQLVNDADRTNNVATLSFTAGQSPLPNLTVHYTDLTFSPNPGLVAQPTTVSARVHNTGAQPATDIAVAFYDGAPAEGGSQIGEIQTLPTLAPGDSGAVSVVTPAPTSAGSQTLFVVVDPQNQINEITKDDNAAFATLTILALPDLAVSSASIQVTPSVPQPGQAVTVAVGVANLGQQTAQNVVVRLTAGGAAAAPDQTIATAAAGSLQTIHVPWNFPSAGGSVPLTVTVDPANAIAEISKDNNAAQITVTAVDPNRSVSERYLSPNGDGVQDTTLFAFSGASGDAVAVEVSDGQGRVVRRAALATGQASFVWNGTDDSGRVVRDGDYTLAVVDDSESSLASAVVTVDTNHWPLRQAFGTSYERIRDLTCSTIWPAEGQFPLSDDVFYFAGTGGGSGAGPLYRGLADGSSIARVFPSVAVHDFHLSHDGTTLALNGSVASGQSTPLWTASADGSNLQPVGSGLFPSPYNIFPDLAWIGDSRQLLYSTNSRSSATVEVHLLDGTPDRLYSSLSSFPVVNFYQQPGGHEDIAPDGRTVLVDVCPHAFFWLCSQSLRLVDVASGTVTSLPLPRYNPSPVYGSYGSATNASAWSPDGSRLAVTSYAFDDLGQAGAIQVFDRAGTLVRRFDVPKDYLEMLPAYRGFPPTPAGPSGQYLDVLEVFQPSWSASGDELVFGALYFQTNEQPLAEFGRLFRANVVTGSLETVGWLEPNFYQYSYHVSTWDGSSWVERGLLHVASLYSEQQLDLSRFLPDPQGDYKVRIHQVGMSGAQIDRLQLRFGLRGAQVPVVPLSAVSDGADVLAKISGADHEVLEAHERLIEARWGTEAPAGMEHQPVALDLVSREQGSADDLASPITFPRDSSRVYNYLVTDESALVVDGEQTAADGLGGPLFAEWTRTDTGHPASTVIGYVKSDATSFYAALDFTVDNTSDPANDWASLFVQTSHGWREFRITAADSTWGAVGFTHTGKVSWTHKYYEWRLPLSEIGASLGSTLAVRFQAYGSAGLLGPSAFLPLYGDRPLWVPGENTILFGQDSSGSTWAIDLDNGNAPTRILDHFTSLASPYFSASGHKLIFQDGKDILDPLSPCYNPSGEYSLFSFQSLANLTAEMSGKASSDGRGIVLSGTAADIDFGSWQLDYADVTVPDFWTSIADPNPNQVFDGELTTWVPPSAGSFLVRLSVTDLAGNKRTVVQSFSSSSSTPATLADVSVTPAYISPNGDGVQDAAVIHYRVLAPVHLDFQVYNARGDLVRDLPREHAQTGGFDVAWDGRDANGLPVPDGTYRLVVEDFQYSIVVDTTPPVVRTLLLHGAGQAVKDPATQRWFVAVDPSLEWCADDANPYTGVIERGEGPQPSSWQELGAFNLVQLCVVPMQSKHLSLGQYVNLSARIKASDLAGNRASAVSGPGPEELILYGFGSDVDSTGNLETPLPVPVDGVWPPIARQSVRFQIAETVREALGQVFIQFIPAAQLTPQSAWVDVPIRQFFERGAGVPGGWIPDGYFDVVWDMAGFPTNGAVYVRLRAVDLAGHETVSNRIGLTLTGALAFEGLVPQGTATDGVGAALAAARLDPSVAPVLWASYSDTESLTDVTLFLESQDDPRYTGGKPLPLAGSSGGVLVFDGSDLLPCKSYRGYVVARTVPPPSGGENPRDLRSDALPVKLPCVGVTVAVHPEDASDCGATSPHRTQIDLTPKSYNGVALRLLTLAIGDSSNVVYNANLPVSDQRYSFVVDTSTLAEGDYPLVALLSNGDGDHAEARRRLVVDRTPPQMNVTWPATGQRVCAVLRNGNKVIDLQGSIQDVGSGFSYVVQVPNSAAPDGWAAQSSWQLVRDGTDLTSGAAPTIPLTNLSAPMPSVGANGSVNVRIQATDLGGNVVCPEVAFVADGLVDNPLISADQALISPNGDGVKDQVTFVFGAAESVTAGVEIFQGRRNLGLSNGPAVPVGPVLRTLVTSVASPAGAPLSAVWDGTLASGATALEGPYVAVAQFVDSCGNVADAHVTVDVDTRPPDVAILAPVPGGAVPLVVPIVGSVADSHLLDWRLEYGAGNRPLAWSLLAQGGGNEDGSLMGLWNTYGLVGDYTLRISARDLAGNTSVVGELLNLPQRPGLVTDLEAMPELFSPNGDGIVDTTAIRLGLASESRVTLQVLDGGGAIVRSLLGGQTLPGGAAVQAWDGLNDAGRPVADGDYQVQINATVTAPSGMSQQESSPVSVDRVAPVLVLTEPQQGFGSAQQGVVGSVADPHLVGWSVAITSTPEAPDWRQIGEGQTAVSNGPLASLAGLAEGSYALRLDASDGAGNLFHQVVPFAVDNTPPAVTLGTPPTGALVGGAGGPVTVSGTIVEVHLSNWRLEVGSGSFPSTWSELASGSSLPTGSSLAEWSVGGLPDGLYTLRLTAQDLGGLTGQTLVTVTVDNTPPVASIAQPASGWYVTQPVAILGTASDLNLLQYIVDLAPAGTQQWSELGRGVSPVVSGQLLSWTALPPDGTYQLRLRVFDRAGNASATIVSVKVSRTPPAPPHGLVATLSGGDGHLGWQANIEPDLVGYNVYRDGTKLTVSPATEAFYTDTGLPEGDFHYTVTAVSRAGLESGPSNVAELLVDRSAPTVRLFQPANGSRVGGLVTVVATAWSNDFREYRLYVEPGDGSAGSTLLVRSATPVQDETIIQWSTLGLSDGSSYTLRLEGEDVRGNVATAQAVVTSDNQAPAVPSGLRAVATASDVAVTWNANGEPDLLGYLLYRHGQLVNAHGPAVGDLRGYVLPAAASPSYSDKSRPDGTWSYRIVAIDQAGNVSAQSAAVSVAIDQRPPHVAIINPPSGTRFDHTLYVLGTSADIDIARVQFEYQALGASSWTNLGSPVVSSPWEVNWDPTGLPLGTYLLQAVATDTGGRTDPAPEAITLVYTSLTRPQRVSGVMAQVFGGDVHLAWTAGRETDLVGYFLDRTNAFGTTVRITAAPVAGASFIDPGLADGTYSYVVTATDTFGNLSDPSSPVQAGVYTPQLVRPMTPTRATRTALSGTVAAGASVAVTVTPPAGPATTLPTVSADGDGAFAVTPIVLALGSNAISVVATDGVGNQSKTASLGVISATPPSAPTGLTASMSGTDVVLSWNSNPAGDVVIGYRAFRDGSAVLAEATVADFNDLTASSQEDSTTGANQAFDSNSFTFWAPATSSTSPAAGQWIAARWPESRLLDRVEVVWASAERRAVDYDVEVWDGEGWLTLSRVRGNALADNIVTFPAQYLTTAVRVEIVTAALADTVLTPVQLAEVRVSYQPLVSTTAATDATPPEGAHVYSATAIDQYGFESDRSSPAEIDVVNPSAPPAVVLSASASGSDVTLSWTAGSIPNFSYYSVLRDGGEIAGVTDSTTLTYLDSNLPNATYRYTVRVVDQDGNVGTASNAVDVTLVVQPPSAPVALSVSAPPNGAELDLGWGPGGGAAAASYGVLRATASGGPYTQVGTAVTTAFADHGVTNGTIYFYVVEALDTANNASRFSNEASGMPQDLEPPLAPVPHFPGFPGIAYDTARNNVPLLVGTAEAGSTVDLVENGMPAGETTALSDVTVDPTGLWVGFSANGTAELSSDGESLWLDSRPNQIYRFDSGTTLAVPIASGPVRWSADGGRMVFTIYNAGTVVESYDLVQGRTVSLAHLDSADVALLSPEGGRVAVVGRAGSQSGLQLVDVASGGVTLLLDSAAGSVDPRSLSWSPDGTRLAYRRTSSSGDLIAVIDVGSAVERVIESQPGPSNPSWSPDGTALVYTTINPAVAGGTEEVARFRLADGNVQVLTSGGVSRSAPQWSPDGASVAYVADGQHVLIQDLASGSTTNLLDLNSWSGVLSWVKGGRLLVVDNGEPIRVTPAGRFAFTSLSLSPGHSTFVATATDAAGNVSPSSLPMIVTVPRGALPDLAVSVSDLTVLPQVALLGQSVSFSATVHNLGSVRAPATQVNLAVVRPGASPLNITTLAPVGALPPGGSQTVSATVVLSGNPGSYTLVAAVDPLDRVFESDKANDRAELPFFAVGDETPLLFATLDHSGYAANQDVRTTVEVANGGPDFTGQITATVEDSAGFQVAILPTFDLRLRSETVWASQLAWNTGSTFAGSYQVHLQLLDRAGGLLKEVLLPFTVSSYLALTTDVATDHGTYTRGSTVHVTGTVSYRVGNAPLAGAHVRIRILDSSSAVVSETFRPLGELLPGSQGNVWVDWPSESAAAGTYSIMCEVYGSDMTLASAGTLFQLTETPLQVVGRLALSNRSPAWGTPLGVSYTVSNRGGAGLTQLPVRVRVLDPSSGQVFVNQAMAVDLTVGASSGGMISVDTQSFGLGNRVAVLEADLPGTGGTSTQVLDVAALTVLDLTPPVLNLVQPTSSAIVPDQFDAVATSLDALSAVHGVEVSVDGTAFQPLALSDAPTGTYARTLSGLSDGSHALVVRAADAWGNSASTPSVVVTVDSTPPAITISGVAEGSTYSTPVTPIVTIIEDHPGPQSITLNGQAFASGTQVSDPGSYQLVVDAADLAGNRASSAMSFSISAGAPQLSATLAWAVAVDADGNGVPSPGDVLEYTATIENSGAGPATGVAWTDAAPANTTLLAGSISTTVGTVDGTSPVHVTIGTLAGGGASATVTLQVRIASPLPVEVIAVSNQATVASYELAPVESDDPATPAMGDPTVTPVVETPAITIDDATAAPGDTRLSFPVQLSVASNRQVTVIYGTTDGTALAGSDYATTAGALSFAVGETLKEVVVPILDHPGRPAGETFSVVLSGPVNATLGRADATGTLPATTAGFYSVPPCRLVDTRWPEGPRGGPPLAGDQSRRFDLASHCGVPAEAFAVSLNITAVRPSVSGFLTVYNADLVSRPGTSTLNLRAGDTRANNAVLAVSSDGLAGIKVFLNAGIADLVIDVNGYFLRHSQTASVSKPRRIDASDANQEKRSVQ